jgi:hypothetical protein
MLLVQGRIGLEDRVFNALNNGLTSVFVCSDETVCTENDRLDEGIVICVSSEKTGEFFITAINAIRKYNSISECLRSLSDADIVHLMPWSNSAPQTTRAQIPRNSEFSFGGAVYIISVDTPQNGDKTFFM